MTSDKKRPPCAPGTNCILSPEWPELCDVCKAKQVQGTKESNPKDIIGARKVPLSVIPFRVLWRVALGLLEGACKYGRHNYRGVGTRASIYFDAVQRHLGSWWEGEDDDPDSDAKLNHIDKAISCLFVLRDSMLQGNWTDDRPPRGNVNMAELNAEAEKLIDQHKDKNPYHWTIKDSKA